MTNRIITLLCILATSFGVLLGKVIPDIDSYSIQTTINPAQIAHTIIFIAAAIFVPITITRKIDNRRKEKDLVIEELNSISKLADDLGDFFNHQIDQPWKKTDFISTMLSLKKISTKSESISTMLTNTTNNPLCYKKLSEKINDHWNVISNDEGVKPTGFKISGTFIQKQNKAQFELSRVILELKVTVNNG